MGAMADVFKSLKPRQIGVLVAVLLGVVGGTYGVYTLISGSGQVTLIEDQQPALQALAIIRRTGLGLGKLTAGFQRFPQVLLNVPVAEKKPIASLPEVAKAVQRVEKELDGRGRVLIRYSGTEPKARVMVEGEDEQRVREYAAELAERIARALGSA